MATTSEWRPEPPKIKQFFYHTYDPKEKKRKSFKCSGQSIPRAIKKPSRRKSSSTVFGLSSSLVGSFGSISGSFPGKIPIKSNSMSEVQNFNINQGTQFTCTFANGFPKYESEHTARRSSTPITMAMHEPVLSQPGFTHYNPHTSQKKKDIQQSPEELLGSLGEIQRIRDNLYHQQQAVAQQLHDLSSMSSSSSPSSPISLCQDVDDANPRFPATLTLNVVGSMYQSATEASLEYLNDLDHSPVFEYSWEKDGVPLTPLPFLNIDETNVGMCLG